MSLHLTNCLFMEGPRINEKKKGNWEGREVTVKTGE
jgi:hypothetical protein